MDEGVLEEVPPADEPPEDVVDDVVEDVSDFGVVDEESGALGASDLAAGASVVVSPAADLRLSVR